ncbi:hypothetical protein FB451DRAFT_1386107 [Mycena latifolia]|nr:hypothetical protein FB451DRAFT_1386107 [Mycena latifolia]
MRLKEDALQSWTSGAQTFSVVNLSLPRPDATSETTCSMLLDASMIPLLPKRFKPPLSGPSTPAFIIADAGRKGAGLFATRDIPAGALVLVEQPLIVVPAIVPFPYQTDPYAALPPRLPQASRDAFFALTNCKPPSECGRVEGIVWTNASQIDLPTPDEMSPTATEYGGVFPTLSRANHSCDLSTTLKWDLASFSIALYAQRPHRAGEEIHIQYIDVLAPHAVRHAQLARYGFTCDCAHCTFPDDVARAALCSPPSRFLPWTTDLRRADDAVIVANIRALDLVAQEGLYALQVPFLEEIALSYALLGDTPHFRLWAQKVVQLCAVQDPERAAEFDAWMKGPRTFRLWGWRAKQRLLRDTKRAI